MKSSLACGGVAYCFKMSLMVVCPETSNSFFLGLYESGNATTHYKVHVKKYVHNTEDSKCIKR